MESLRGGNALVTGASGGIGSHIARALAQQGMNLALCARREDLLKELAAELEAGGVNARVVPTDLSDLDQAQSLIQRTEEALGPVDVVVNNAGVELSSAYTRYTAQELRWMVDINLTAPMLIAREALPGMLQRRRGHIVFMASLAGKAGPAYEGPYAATKAGLVGLTQSLRGEHSGSPVGFSVICPGFVAGDGMYQRMVERGVAANRLLGHTTVPAVVEAVIEAIRRDQPEMILNSTPVRPMLALAQLSPRTVERAMKRIGATEVFRRTAAQEGRV